MKAVIISGSKKDKDHVKEIVSALEELKVACETHYYSAHKETKELLAVLDEYNPQKGIVFITVAGKSNALSGIVACNTDHLVIACPPLLSTADYLVDIHSTLRMPSKCPVLTILRPENCALAVKRIMKLRGDKNED